MAGCLIKERAKPASASSASPTSSTRGPGLSHAKWSARSPNEKLERPFGMSLDDIREIQSWPMGELDPFRLSVRMQVMRVVFMIGLKAHLDSTLACAAARERDGRRLLEELDSRLRERAEQTAGANGATTPAT